MIKLSNVIFSFIIISFIITSCSNNGKSGDFTLVMSGSMHGQLDPCG